MEQTWLLAKRSLYDELGVFASLRVIRCRFDMEWDMDEEVYPIVSVVSN